MFFASFVLFTSLMLRSLLGTNSLGARSTSGNEPGSTGRHFPSLHQSQSASRQKPLVGPVTTDAFSKYCPDPFACCSGRDSSNPPLLGWATGLGLSTVPPHPGCPCSISHSESCPPRSRPCGPWTLESASPSDGLLHVDPPSLASPSVLLPLATDPRVLRSVSCELASPSDSLGYSAAIRLCPSCCPAPGASFPAPAGFPPIPLSYRSSLVWSNAPTQYSRLR